MSPMFCRSGRGDHLQSWGSRRLRRGLLLVPPTEREQSTWSYKFVKNQVRGGGGGRGKTARGSCRRWRWNKAQEVDSLREQRPGMVQRNDQVALIYLIAFVGHAKASEK